MAGVCGHGCDPCCARWTNLVDVDGIKPARFRGRAELALTDHGLAQADALLDHAAHNNVSTLVLGRTRERPLARMLNRTLTQQLIQHGAHYEITIISTPRARARARRDRLLTPAPGRAPELAQAVVACTLACLVAWVAERWVGMAVH